ncbi:hypothetical protein [Streptoalloteichus hindustanus]|uniref:hypothetical protein n=1 Tax=Streptoalloteichus hindustanus TaxID=2017 RepID=UPI00116117B2|nr:hypothetical protein [Streptoalloteichus hindustanus]
MTDATTASSALTIVCGSWASSVRQVGIDPRPPRPGAPRPGCHRATRGERRDQRGRRTVRPPRRRPTPAGNGRTHPTNALARQVVT